MKIYLTGKKGFFKEKPFSIFQERTNRKLGIIWMIFMAVSHKSGLFSCARSEAMD